LSVRNGTKLISSKNRWRLSHKNFDLTLVLFCLVSLQSLWSEFWRIYIGNRIWDFHQEFSWSRFLCHCWSRSVSRFFLYKIQSGSEICEKSTNQSVGFLWYSAQTIRIFTARLIIKPNGRILRSNFSWSLTRAKFCQLIASLFVFLCNLNWQNSSLSKWSLALKINTDKNFLPHFFRVQLKFAFRIRPKVLLVMLFRENFKWLVRWLISVRCRLFSFINCYYSYVVFFRDGRISKSEMVDYFLKISSSRRNQVCQIFKHDFVETTFFHPTFCEECDKLVNIAFHVYYTSPKYVTSLGTHLFVEVLRPGDSEVTFSVFESSCHLLLPV